MTYQVYSPHGILVRDPRGAEPPHHPPAAGLVGALRWRDRAPAQDAADLGVQAPPRVARGRLRGGAHRGPAARLSAPARAAQGGRRLAGAVPAPLDRPRGPARTPSRSDGADIRERKEAMSNREEYAPGPATGAQVRKDGEKWTLVLVRELGHAPEKVWRALPDPAQLREWAPFDADTSLGTAGATVRLTTVGAPTPHVTETTVTRADAPRALEYTWGGFEMRWELEALGSGTRLTLWTNIDRRYISMGAAGGLFCFDVRDRLLAGRPIGRIVGPEAMKFGGWQRLHAEYAKQFGAETPGWAANAQIGRASCRERV